MSTKQTVLSKVYACPTDDDPDMRCSITVTSDHEEAFLDVGYGCAILGSPALREVAEALIYCADRIEGKPTTRIRGS